MKITVDEARAFFAHGSQQKASSISPEQLPADGVEYWACDGVCGLFHLSHWPGVWMAHYGVKPEAWGRTKEPALRVLSAFWAARQPELIIGWTAETNRAAIAFARRLGFTQYGRMDLPSGAVVCQQWRP